MECHRDLETLLMIEDMVEVIGHRPAKAGGWQCDRCVPLPAPWPPLRWRLVESLGIRMRRPEEAGEAINAGERGG